MSQRVEWMSAPWVSIQIAEDGETFGGDTVTAGAAIAIEADEKVVIEGTREQLRGLVARLAAEWAAFENGPDYNVCPENESGVHGPVVPADDQEGGEYGYRVACAACGTTTGIHVEIPPADQIEWN